MRWPSTDLGADGVLAAVDGGADVSEAAADGVHGGVVVEVEVDEALDEGHAHLVDTRDASSTTNTIPSESTGGHIDWKLSPVSGVDFTGILLLRAP